MLRKPRLASTLYFLAVVCSLCVLANSSVVARPAKNTPVAPPPKQAPVRTDLTPRDKNDCLAVAQTLNEQARKLSRQTKRGIPQEFTRVASDLDQSCGAEDFKKAWVSIDWMNGCLNNFTKDAELGFCSRNGGYSCALSPSSDDCPKDQ
jgi:hypothetical protein